MTDQAACAECGGSGGHCVGAYRREACGRCRGTGREPEVRATICPSCASPVGETESVLVKGQRYHDECYDGERDVDYCGDCGVSHRAPGSCVRRAVRQ